jgi:hypothetical protein
MSIIFVTTSLSAFYLKSEQADSHKAAVPSTLNSPVLSTVFEISRFGYQSLRFNDGRLIVIRDDLSCRVKYAELPAKSGD